MPYFRQVLNDKTGCISYIIGCPTHQTWAVVDPQPDIEQYLQLAQREGYKISHIFDTHIHADHISGARKLAENTGAKIHLYKDAQVKFDFTALQDGEVVKVGNQRISAIHTPGHTPEHVCLLHNQFLLTGDTLFVGDVGRLDLQGAGTAEELYHSLFDKLLKLDDYLAVMPAHYGKSACGKGLSPVPNSTLGFEKRNNYALKPRTVDEFVKLVSSNPPAPPADYLRIKKTNTGAA